MCTVSWVHEGQGFQLFCNRDEKFTRALAASPRIQVRDGIRLIAPLDAAAGGTWIGVNEFGVALTILNRPPKEAVHEPARSRGLLALDLLSATCLAEALERAWRHELSRYAPFTLAVLEAGQPAALMEWDGRSAAIVPYGEPYMPLVSSSFDEPGAWRSRREEFARRVSVSGKVDAGVLSAFHASHSQGPSPYSPCMHRSDAETVSFTRVCVAEPEITMYYSPAAPCKGAPVERVALPCRS